MPGNPSIIPGIHRADLHGLTTLGQALGEFFTRDRRAIEEAMELINDEKFMQDTAMGYEAALAQDRLNPNYDDIASAAGAGSAASSFLHARMIAAGLDPTNEKHRAAALPVLESARTTLTAPMRAQAQLAASTEHVANLAELGREEVSGATEEVRAKAAEAKFKIQYHNARTVRGVGREQAQYELDFLLNESAWERIQRRYREDSESAADADPRLGALLGVSRQGFQEGLLQLMRLEAQMRAGGQGLTLKEQQGALESRRAIIDELRMAVYQAEGEDEARAAADAYNSMIREYRILAEQYGLPRVSFPTELKVEEVGKSFGNLFGLIGSDFRVVTASTSPSARGPISVAEREGHRAAIQTSLNAIANRAGSLEELEKEVSASIADGSFGFLKTYSRAQREEMFQWLSQMGLLTPNLAAYINELNNPEEEKKEERTTPQSGRSRAEEIRRSRFGALGEN